MLFKILYAAHARGTHHKIALHGLRRLSHPDARGWRRAMLAHAELYMRGAKAPDDDFKDFQNHVRHPGVGDAASWGGAPETAARWWTDTVDALADQDWETAAFNAGVLTHYLSDPLMPLHTGSSDAETIVHRGLEWSCSKSFESIWRSAADGDGAIPGAPTGADVDADWIAAAVDAGAACAHANYGRLIDAYDPEIGAKRPTEGLSEVGRDMVGTHLAQAVALTAQALDGAFVAAGVSPPRVALTAKTVVAGLQMPAKWVLKRIDDAEDRRAVQAIFDEVRATGALVDNLPDEQRAVQRIAAAAAARERARRAAPRPRASAPSTPKPTPRPKLMRSDPVERVPGVGAKRSAQLAALGVRTVGDLLKADAAGIASRLSDRRVDRRTVAAWRDRGALLVKIADLRSSHATLLVAVGLRSVEQVANADAADLHRRMTTAHGAPELARLVGRTDPPSADAAAQIVASAEAATRRDRSDARVA